MPTLTPGKLWRSLSFAARFTIAYAIGVHFAISPTRRGVIGPTLLSLGGVGLILCGLFPWTQDNGVLVEPAGHTVAAIT